MGTSTWKRFLFGLIAHIDDRRSYKEKFDEDSFTREPPEFWHGVNARLQGISRESCPYWLEKNASWKRGFDGKH